MIIGSPFIIYLRVALWKITGFGEVNGRSLFISADDVTVMAGRLFDWQGGGKAGDVA